MTDEQVTLREFIEMRFAAFEQRLTDWCDTAASVERVEVLEKQVANHEQRLVSVECVVPAWKAALYLGSAVVVAVLVALATGQMWLGVR